MVPASLARRTPLVRAGYGLAVMASLAVWLLPLMGVAFTSMHSVEDLNRGNIWGWPAHLALVDNYATVVTGSHTGQMVVNSFLITIPAVIGTVLLSAMAGFALAKHPFRGNRLLLMVFVAGNLVPFQVLMIPVRDLVIALHLYDSRWAPDTLLDTARVDGAGELRVFWLVVVPLIRPAIAAVSVLIFTCKDS